MPRFARHEPVLRAAAHWRDEALAGDGSVLFAGRSIWTPANVDDLSHFFVLAEGPPSGTFEEKLKIQLGESPPDVKILAAEMLWVMMLFPSNVSGDRKREKVNTILDWAGERMPDSPALHRALDRGVGHSGQGFLTHQPFELSYFVHVMKAWKALDERERSRLLADPWAFGDWLNEVPEKGERQLWHIIPFLVFPDFFDTTASINHKRKILAAFADEADKGPDVLPGVEPRTERTQIDLALYRLRKKLEAQSPEEEVDFYRPPFREVWQNPGPVPEFAIDSSAFDAAVAAFRVHHPDFSDFEDPGIAYPQGERDYKDEFADRVRAFLDRFSDRDPEEAGVALVDELITLLQSKLETIGNPQNLIGWRYFDFLRQLEEPEKIAFARIFMRLFETEYPAPDRIDLFNLDLWPILERHDATSYAVSRSFPTLFLMMADPENEIFIRTELFNDLARRFTGSKLFKHKRLDAAEYRAAQAFVAAVAEQLASRKMPPRDMIDLQSWMWQAWQELKHQEEERARAGTEEGAGTSSIGEPHPPYGDPPEELPFGALISHLHDQGLYFDPELVANYLLAMETRRLVILAGISGTGKTRLAMATARFLQERPDDSVGSSERDIRVIAVRPDWTDPRALLGYHNPILDRYVPTDFLRVLLEARQEERDADTEGRTPRPYFVILDEMNLARVEHYFADFLSALESDSPIVLHDTAEGLALEDDADEGAIPPRLRIPQNVFFTGTVNVDETTYMFSPKVLDRAFTLELNRVDLQAYGDESREDSDTAPLGISTLPRPLRWERRPNVEDWKNLAMIDEGALSRLLVELNRGLSDSQHHFGYRVANEIARFVGLVWSRSGKDPGAAWRALDLAVLQKVLPKFHGTEQELDVPLRTVLRHAVGDENAESMDDWTLSAGDFAGRNLPQGDSTIRLPRTLDKLRRMRARLQAQGFTSYLE